MGEVLHALRNLNSKIDGEQQTQPKPKTVRQQTLLGNIANRQTVRFSSTVDEEELVEDPYSPFWLDDTKLGDGTIVQLSSKELEFWEGFIEKYLKPFDKDKKKEEKTKAELLELRTFVVMTFSMINFLWIVIIFLLQYLGEDDNIKGKLYIPIQGGDDPQRIEPFGLIFLIFFSIILVLQFFAAIVHRIGTLLHLLAVTPLLFKGDNLDKAFQIFEKEMFKTDDDDSEDVYDDVPDRDVRLEEDIPPALPRRNTAKDRSKLLRQLSQHQSGYPTVPSTEDYIRPPPRLKRKAYGGQKSRQPQIVHGGTDILTRQFKRNFKRQTTRMGGSSRREPQRLTTQRERDTFLGALSERDQNSRMYPQGRMSSYYPPPRRQQSVGQSHPSPFII